MVQLKESLCAAEDKLFCEFQRIIRMNPLTLRSDYDLKHRFIHLTSTVFTYFDNWGDYRIVLEITRMYSWKVFVKSATALHTDSLLRQINDQNDITIRVRNSIDQHARRGSNAEYTNTSIGSIASFNHQLREPQTLIFHPWCVYECTTNDKNGQYNQSTIDLLIDVSSQ